jgi:hypothetical protein
MKSWSKTLGYTIDPYVYKGKIHGTSHGCEHDGPAWETFWKHNGQTQDLILRVRNKQEIKANRIKDEAREVSSLTQIYKDRLSHSKVDTIAPLIDLENVVQGVTLFTTEAWLYHSDSCPMYKDLLEWCDKLKGLAFIHERFHFTPRYLRRTLWKMMVEMDRFCEQECAPEIFVPGTAQFLGQLTQSFQLFYPNVWTGTRWGVNPSQMNGLQNSTRRTSYWQTPRWIARNGRLEGPARKTKGTVISSPSGGGQKEHLNVEQDKWTITVQSRRDTIIPSRRGSPGEDAS